MSKRISKIWVDKYMPTQISQVIFQNAQHKQQFEAMIARKEIPHLLFSGVQGTGKSTLSRVLSDLMGVDENDVLIIKASEETGVDMMRDKIKNFAQCYALSKFKIIRLEEMDYLSPNAQAALRTIMEDFSDNCRFIGTCNYANKIIPALISRFQHFDFKAPDKSELTIRIAEILSEECVEFELDVLERIVSVGYPDIRKTINLAQQNTIDKVLTLSETASSQDWRFEVLTKLQTGDFKGVRKIVSENATREEFEDLYRFIYQNVNKITKLNEEKRDAAIVILANYLYRHSLVADPELNFAACLIEIGQLLD